MEISIRIEIDGRELEPVVVSRIERNGSLRAGTLGLTLAESKSLLEALQRELVESQFRWHIEDQRSCNQCGAWRAIKDYHPVCFKSLFGDVSLRVPRLDRCRCEDQPNRTETVKIEGLSPWVSPELEFLQSRLSAMLPYARASELLALLLPIAAGNATSTVRRRTLSVGQRLDADLKAAYEDKSVGPQSARESVIAVGLDGGYVHDSRPGSDRSFEVVVGRILNPDGESRSVGFVRTLETNREAGRRLQRRIQEQGSTAKPLTVFTDGDPSLFGIGYQAEHVLD